MSEANEAKRDGARLQPNSGRGKHNKGDAKWRGYIVDYKEYAQSFGVSRKVWAKISTDAFKAGGKPCLKLILGSEHKLRLAVVEWTELERLLRTIEILEQELADGQSD